MKRFSTQWTSIDTALRRVTVTHRDHLTTRGASPLAVHRVDVPIRATARVVIEVMFGTRTPREPDIRHTMKLWRPNRAERIFVIARGRGGCDHEGSRIRCIRWGAAMHVQVIGIRSTKSVQWSITTRVVYEERS